ncbi:MAG: hypothetical protein KJ737_04300 [Proteobacteria bacterium]|nr:hypothetical protein [Pseudomonadota bacterium]
MKIARRYIAIVILYGWAGDENSKAVSGDTGAISFEIRWPEVVAICGL